MLGSTHGMGHAFLPRLLHWTLMIAAMMAPILAEPIRVVRSRSFAKRRPQAVGLFVAGYTAVWVAAGIALLALSSVLDAHVSPVKAAAFVFGVAMTWQCAPAKQWCLNCCHATPDLAAFGLSADLAVARFGVTRGSWCAGSCWALMWMTAAVPTSPMFAMAAVSLLILSESIERPRPVRWEARGCGRAVRLLIAQARLLVERAGIATGNARPAAS